MRFFVLLSILGLGGCAASSYCVESQPYQYAQSVPPITSVGGLQLAESPSALRIPPPPDVPVSFGEVYQVEDDRMVRCLDMPPHMPLPAAPPAAVEEKIEG